jgi:plastocyanin
MWAGVLVFDGCFVHGCARTRRQCWVIHPRKAAAMFSEIVPSLRRRSLRTCLSVLVLAAALVVMPTIASSETPSISAYDEPGLYGFHSWMPATATVSAGGVVKFSNPYSEVPHGLKFTGSPATPSCTGIPAAATEATGATSWHGECMFSAPGTYSFVCTVHPTEMKGTVTVNASGTVTPGPTPGSPESPSSPTGSGGSGSGGSLGAGGSPFAGGSKALKLAPRQHGRSVHGSIDVSPAGASGELEVALLATSASLAKAHHPKRVRVGHFVRSSVKAGVVSFAVPLTAHGKSALRRHRRLALTVRIVLTPFYGTPVSMTKSVVLHA